MKRSLDARIKLFKKKRDEEKNRQKLIDQAKTELGILNQEFTAITKNLYESLKLDTEEIQFIEEKIRAHPDSAENYSLLSQIIIDRREKKISNQQLDLKTNQSKNERVLKSHEKNIRQYNTEIKNKIREIQTMKSQKDRILTELSKNKKYQDAMKFREVLYKKIDEGYFKGRVIGPVIAYIEPKSEKFADIVEPIIGTGDLESFAFEFDEDRILAYNELTNQGKAHKVNMFSVEPKRQDKSLESIRNDGFDGTLNEHVVMHDLISSHYNLVKYPYKIVSGRGAGKIPDKYWTVARNIGFLRIFSKTSRSRKRRVKTCIFAPQSCLGKKWLTKNVKS